MSIMVIWQICITLKFNLFNRFYNKRCLYPSNLLFGFYSIKVGLYTGASLFILHTSAWTTGIAALRHREIEKWRIYNWSNKLFRITSPGDAGELWFSASNQIGEWIHADFKRVRNYAFHKRFSNSCNWDSITGLRSVGRSPSRTKTAVWFRWLPVRISWSEHTPALSDAAEQYLNTVATREPGIRHC